MRVWGLEEAVEAFYPSYKESKEATEKRLEQPIAEEGKFSDMMVRLSYAMGTYSDQNDYRSKLIALVESGQVWLCGYIAPVLSDSKPTKLDARFLKNASVDWKKNTIKTGNREIVNVFVTMPVKKMTPAVMEAKQVTQVESKPVEEIQKSRQEEVSKKERYSCALQIQETYQKLKASKEINLSQTKKEIYKKVKKFVPSYNPNLPKDAYGKYKGLSESSVERAISDLIDADKKSK